MRDINVRPGAFGHAKTKAPTTRHFFNLLPKKKKKKHGPMFPGGVRDPETSHPRPISPNRMKNEALFRRIKAAQKSGGRRKTRRRRKKRRKRKTRSGGNSPLHIRRRLKNIAERSNLLRSLGRKYVSWKNERQRHKDAKVLAKSEMERSHFGKIPKGTNEY
jgi:hypothetical protein